MGAKAKINREMISNVAFDILLKEGESNVNARNVAKRLECSTQPLYSYFQNMKDLEDDILKLSLEEFKKDMYSNLNVSDNVLYNISFNYINFAITKKNLFNFILFSHFSDDVKPETIFEEIKRIVDINKVLGKICIVYNLDEDAIKTVFIRIWNYVHGVACYTLASKAEFNKEQNSSLKITIDEMIRNEMVRRSLS